MTHDAQSASKASVVDELSGPTLEIRYTEILYGRGADLWEILLLAKPDCETRIRIDWNGINARAWDMSFVPWDRLNGIVE